MSVNQEACANAAARASRVCVCVRACARARACVCVCVRARVRVLRWGGEVGGTGVMVTQRTEAAESREDSGLA